MAVLNEIMATKQKITPLQRGNLLKIYDDIEELFNQAAKDENISINGRSYADKLKQAEFDLQKNWNFPEDELFHKYWNKFSRCTCPKLDNEERFGFDKIFLSDCPFHGNF